MDPSSDPSLYPTNDPSLDPTTHPSLDPTIDPSLDPLIDPTLDPSADPSMNPSLDPSADPSLDPTLDPTVAYKSFVELIVISVNILNDIIDPSIDPSADSSLKKRNCLGEVHFEKRSIFSLVCVQSGRELLRLITLIGLSKPSTNTASSKPLKNFHARHFDGSSSENAHFWCFKGIYKQIYLL